MNDHQLKQVLGNNFWHGENRRREPLDILPLPTAIPDDTRIFGVDISHWNLPPVNLKRMVDLYKLRFVIAKGCDGSVNSRYYFEHVSAAKMAGVPWGMYVWLYPASRVNMDAQVNAWHARAMIDPPPLGIFIDCEWTTYGGRAANPNATDLRLAHDKLKVLQGKSATTYTASGYANTYLKGFDWSREELWIAHYGVVVPTLPMGATGYQFWQFTSKFMFDGVNYDGNYFNGTEQEFIERYGGIVPPPPTGEPMKYTATATANDTRLRPDHNVNAPYLGTYPSGTKFNGDVLFIAAPPLVPNQLAGDQWLEVKEIVMPDGARIVKSGWVAIIHMAKPICSLVENVEPPPPATEEDEIVITVNGVVKYDIKGKLQ